MNWVLETSVLPFVCQGWQWPPQGSGQKRKVILECLQMLVKIRLIWMNMARIDSVCVINLWNFRWIIAYFPIAFKDCEVFDQFQWLWNRTFSERVNWAFTLTEAPVAIWKKVWLQQWWWRGGWRWWQWGEDDKTGVHLGDGMLWYFDDLTNKSLTLWQGTVKQKQSQLSPCGGLRLGKIMAVGKRY